MCTYMYIVYRWKKRERERGDVRSRGDVIVSTVKTGRCDQTMQVNHEESGLSQTAAAAVTRRIYAE